MAYRNFRAIELLGRSGDAAQWRVTQHNGFTIDFYPFHTMDEAEVVAFVERIIEAAEHAAP